jgi:WD40 repeat protein
VRRRGRKSKLRKSKQKADNCRDSTDNNTLKLWDADSGNKLLTIAGQEYEGFYFKSVALSPNGKWIIAGSLDGIDGKITIYDIASPEEVEAELLAEEEGSVLDLQ